MREGAAARKGERTRQDILRAAKRQFAEHGFEATRLEDIAADVGIRPSGILYYFPDKRALYGAVLDQLSTGLFVDLHRTMAGRGSLGDRIEAVVDAVIDYVVANPEAAHFALREAAARVGSAGDQNHSRAAPLFELIAGVITLGTHRGRVRPRTDAFHLTSLLAGAVTFYVAALPALVPKLPYNHLAPDQVKKLKREIVEIAQQLLAIRPRAVCRRGSSR